MEKSVDELLTRRAELRVEINALESQKTHISNRIGVLKEELEKVHIQLFPFRVGELFYFITDDGKVESDIWYADEADVHKYFHCFATKSKEETLRLQEAAEKCILQNKQENS